MTDPFTALTAAAAAAASEGAALQHMVDLLTAQAAADDATIADLKHQIDILTPKPAPQPTPAASTVFGMNLGSRSVAQRITQFGRVPMVKLFSLTDVATLPEKRAQLCLPYAPGELQSGIRDASIVAHIKAQLAAGAKRIVYTYRQEPEDVLRGGQAAVDQWKADTKHLAALVKANGRPGVTLVAPCLIAPHVKTGMAVPDAWMMTPDDLGGLDWSMWTWDDYGNPFGAKNYAGDVYATPYPTGAEIASQMFPLLIKFGWTRWGVAEFNTPWRKDLKPADADHSGRIKYLEDYVQTCLAAPAQIGPPDHMFLWEEVGNQFDQTFTLPTEYAWWKSWVAKSA